MVDRTIYPSKEFTPENSLRQIFARQKAPEKLCILIAQSGLMSVERFAVLGETLTDVKDTFKVLIRDENKLGATDPEKVLALTLVASIWKNCTVLQDHFATRRARMEEDPSKIPEISQELSLIHI